ncbi:phage tail tape measure protein [Bergeyella zoohelcum]|uniref:Phage tail tape measure protein domain-containing protein n=1 Tax=Bergeyella zoohelcum ATCC 43767 TaxID=883096 RepID=K1LIS0_9FLAO|nr:phage tail tape measure protein [Bergeyella zoohelcum]EKB56620.1 hypothetical protein HMPREF9699_01349 [Bergeyella zoohelcum ATCC 43767]SUV48472.1 ATPase involved in DNA repair [Bergeyella zoohelcum]
MARKISDELIDLKIVVNGDEAQKRVADLEKENEKLSESLREQKKIMENLSRQRKKDSEEYKNAEKEVKKLTEAIADNKKIIDIEIHGMNIMSLTMQQLQKRANDLRHVLTHMAPGTDEFKATQAELSQINTRINELRSGSRAATSTLNNLADKFNHYSGMAVALSATLVGVGMSIQSTIDLNNKMADAQTAVAKTTGMTDKQVKELTNSFSEFDTRTKNIDLLKIAEIGGRLGVPKNEIKEFTREVDKAYVALGDSFSGGVEAVANKLGKIKGLFRETKDLDMATAINQIGSSMNDLGASGAASEENIAEFTVRVGALPDKLKPTVAEAMALGAAFEESGVDAERSATAYSNFIKTAATDTEGFARIMNVPVQQVKDMINSDPTEFFLKFSEGLKGLDATEVSAILKSLKLNDQYLTSIVGAASEKTELFRKSIERSNQSLTEATSLQEEFNKVNNNAAAIYEKVQKKFLGIFQTEAVANTLNWLIEMFGRLLGVTIDNGEEQSKLSKILIGVTRIIAIVGAGIISTSVAMALYNGLIKESIVRTIALEAVEKARMLRLRLITILQTGWNLAIGAGGAAVAKFISLLGFKTIATNLQTAAQTKLNAAMSANPIGAVIALVGLLVTAILTYNSVIGDTEKKQKTLNDVMKDATDRAADETSALDILYKKATDDKLSREERLKAVQKLQEQYPSYFKDINAEIIMNGKAADSYYALRDAILASARAEAIKDELKERQKERLKRDEQLNQKIENEKKKYTELSSNEKHEETIYLGGDEFGIGQTVTLKNKDLKVASKKRWTNLVAQQMRNKIEDEKADSFLTDALVKEEKASAKLRADKEAALKKQLEKSNYIVPTSGGDATGKDPKKTEAERRAEQEAIKYKEQKDKLLKEQEKYDEQSKAIELKAREMRMELMEEGYNKELEKIRLEEAKKLNELEKQKHSEAELKKLDEIIAKETGEEKQKFEAIKTQWLKHNADLTELKKQEETISALKIKVLKEKFIAEDLKRAEEVFNKKVMEQKTKENEMIASLETVEQQKAFLKDKISKDEYNKIRTWEDGKNALQKHYAKESLKIQEAYIKEQIKNLADIPDAALTQEQVKALEGMKAKLAEIGVELGVIRAGEAQNSLSTLSGFSGSADILGLTPEQWEAMFINWDTLEGKIQRIGAAMKIAQNIMTSYHQFAKANQEAELRRFEVAHERKKKALETQLAAGLISQQEYKHKTIANENELAMKKWQLEFDATKREKNMKIADAVGNTALAVMNIWSKHAKNPWMAAALTAVATAMGAVQVATIERQPLPEPPVVVGAQSGYYPVIRKQDGKMFQAKKQVSKSGIYDEPTMLVGEQGKNFPELVVSGKAMKRIDPKLKKDFMNEVARVEGFEKGFYPQLVMDSKTSDEVMKKILNALEKNTEALEKLERNGVRGVFEKNARTGKDLEEMQKEYRRLIEKNKH